LREAASTTLMSPTGTRGHGPHFLYEPCGLTCGPLGKLVDTKSSRREEIVFPLKEESFCRLQTPVRDEGGFSLLEMMTVIIIIGLLSGLVLATFSSTGSAIERQATALATVIRTLDDTAAARRETLELKFDFKKRTVSWAGTDGGENTREFDMLVGVEALSLGLVHEGELTVMFDPSYTTESMLVHLESDDEKISVLYNPLGRRTRLIGPEPRED